MMGPGGGQAMRGWDVAGGSLLAGCYFYGAPAKGGRGDRGRVFARLLLLLLLLLLGAESPTPRPHPRARDTQGCRSRSRSHCCHAIVVTPAMNYVYNKQYNRIATAHAYRPRSYKVQGCLPDARARSLGRRSWEQRDQQNLQPQPNPQKKQPKLEVLQTHGWVGGIANASHQSINNNRSMRMRMHCVPRSRCPPFGSI